MAQKSGSRSGSGRSTAKRPASAARSTGTSKKTTSKTGTKSPARGSANGSTAPRQTARTANAEQPLAEFGIRREVGAIVLLFVGLIAFISWFPAKGWLVDGYRGLMRGLFGWGYFLAPIGFFWGMALLWTNRDRPVRARLVCVLLIPAVFGAFVHAAACSRDGFFADGFGYGIRQLWRLSQDPIEHAGGAIAGTVGYLLRKSISPAGGFIVLLVALVLMAARGANITVMQLWEMIRERYRQMNDEDETDEPEEDEPSVPQEKTAKAAKSETKTKPVRRRVYDEDWEARKDYLFAEMGVDKQAELRMAAAVRDEKKARDSRTKPAKKPVALAEKPAPEKPKPSSEKPAAPDLSEVEPLSVEEAAGIAGVEIHSADMDAGAAGPAVKKEKIDKDAEAAAVADEIAAAEEDKPTYVFPDMGLLNKSDPKRLAMEASTDENEERLTFSAEKSGVCVIHRSATS